MKITRVINVAALMLGVLLLCQCTKEEKSAVQPQANVPATVKMAYIFAKDIFEANQRAQNKLENVRQQKAAELQRFQSEIEQKGRNNGYLTEESYKADMQKYQQMGYDAERHMNDLQNKFVNENNLSLKQLNDSIDKCISEYAKKNGISVVLDKKATYYVNGIPNITNDIVKILNERYNKVEKK